MANVVPEKNINFAVYNDGGDMLGMATVEMPQMEAMTSDVQGAGIAGVANSIVLGHFNAMTMTINWRNTTVEFARLAAHKTHDIDLYGAQQDYDAGLGEYVVKHIHYFVRGIQKSSPLGNLNVGEGAENQSVFEVVYLMLEIDGVEKIVMDKFNYIYRVEGVDYLADVRSALGKM